MKMNEKIPTDEDIVEMKRRRLEAMHLQVIEGNPLDDEQIAMFEMFEREKWTDKQCLEHLNARAHSRREKQ